MKTMLEGMKVADFTINAAGPTCTAMLADYGANVLKIEKPLGGDDCRNFGLPIEGQSIVHTWVNRGKGSVTVDLNTPEGQEMAKRLALEADIVCESFRPGIMAKFGLDYETLKKEKPNLIYCSISAFGLSGPYAKKPGYDLIAQAMSGLIDLIGEPDGPPMKSGLVIGDYWGGVNAFCGVITAWLHYLRTGEGQLVDASLVQNLVYLNSAILDFNAGLKTTRGGNHHKAHSPYGVFQGKDNQWAVISVENDEEWQKLAALMSRADLKDAKEAERVANRAVYTKAVEDWLAGFANIDDAVAKVEELGIIASKAGDMHQVADDAHIAANEWIVDVPMPLGVKSHPTFKSRNVNAGFSKTPGVARRAPLLGENNMEVLTAAGYDKAYIEELQAKWRVKPQK